MESLRILFVEDSEDDAELEARELRQAGISFEWKRVDRREELRAALQTFRPDLVLSDFALPDMGGLDALRIVREQDPDVPFIFVSGTIGEERAIESLKRGAWDYVLKGGSRRLGPAVQQAIREMNEQRERKKAQSALRQSESRFRTLVESNIIGVIVADLDGKVLEANDAFLRMTGHARADLHAASWAAPPRDEFLKSGSVPTRETVIRHKKGHEIPALVAMALLPGEQCLGFVMDLTDQKRLQAQFLQSQKMEAIGRLAGGVAHDFNNLLTVINGYGERVLHRLAAEDPNRGDVEEIERAGRRAAELTRQLLAFSRKQVLNPQLLDLGRVIRELEPMLRRLIGEDVRLETRTPASPLTVRADRTHVEQVIMNLAVNAKDAMPNGGRLAIDVEEAPGGWAATHVRDTGTGMPPEVMAHLFEPFFTTKESGKGTGLGLATVHGIVQQSGGQIAVESSVGQGTTFRILLPRAEGAVEATPVALSNPRPAGRKTILLVEDDAAICKLASTILSGAGYTVVAAVHGRDALEKFRRDEVDLVLTDVVMPEMSGTDLIRELRRANPDLPVILMSGYPELAAEREIGAIPNSSFLQKPFIGTELLGRIAEVLAR